MEEAEGVLGDFVARNGLSGSVARLCIPADRFYSARISFPPIREKDLRPALALELERLFPFPPSRLRFRWSRLDEATGGKGIPLVVTAVPSDYIERWEEAVSRVGLHPAGAISSGWAVSSALSVADHGPGAHKGVTAILRETGVAVECSVLVGGVPIFCATRQCAEDSMPAEGLSLLEEGLVDARSRGEDDPVALVAPPGWFAGKNVEAAGGSAVRHLGDFPLFPGMPPSGQGGTGESISSPRIAGAFGAGVAGRAVDLAKPGHEGAASRLARISAWLLVVGALVFAHAWPATLYWKTKAELARLDKEIAALHPAVAEVEESIEELSLVAAKITLLREAVNARGESFLILKELTDRLPEGTWLTGLRVEERKIEMDGLSPSANEIFPLLTRDGRFRGVAFTSPITRQPDNLERFRISAEFVPQPPAEKEAAR